MSEKSIKAMMDAIPNGWDRRPVGLAHEISRFLESVKDQGTAIDSGTNGVTGDLWVTVQGVEYFITIQKSKKQLASEAG